MRRIIQIITALALIHTVCPASDRPLPLPPAAALGMFKSIPFTRDNNLEWCVRMSLGANGISNPYTIPIDDTVIQKIKRIECESPLPKTPGLNDFPSESDKSSTIKDLRGIEYFYNLEVLIINGSTLIEDLYYLSALDNITKIDIKNSKIKNISALAYTPKLQRLILDDNSVTDLTPLAGLANLKQLSLPRQAPSYITDISPLAGKSTLTDVNFSGNKISDISAFANSRLQNLYIGDNRLRSIEPLRSVTTLIKANFDVNMISDLTPLGSSLATLQVLGIAQNNVTNLEFITGPMPSFNTLGAQGNMISDLGPLMRISPVKAHSMSLDLARNDIRSVEPLRQMINDRKIYRLLLSYNCIPNIENIGFLNDTYRLPLVQYPHQCQTPPPYDAASLGNIVNKDLVYSTQSSNGNGDINQANDRGTSASGCALGGRTAWGDPALAIAAAIALLIRRKTKPSKRPTGAAVK